MASTALDRKTGEIVERPATGPGRELGQKRKPMLKLALGYRDENRKGAPVKTDYFIPRGEDMIVAKFREAYGDKPKAIDIRLPSSLGGFLDIRHVAFAGGQNDGGGILKAIGTVNFALEGTLGGPDKLTVWNAVETGQTDRNNNPIKELQTDEVYIDDVDDPAAKELGVYLQASVTFGIPDVLGFGGVCELRSRGKETIDTLWLTAVDIYGQLGARASMVLRPQLILKESSMMTPRAQKAQVWVVDLFVPQSLDEVMSGMRELRELTGPSAPALYGARAIESPSEEPSHEASSTASEGVHQQAGTAASAAVLVPDADFGGDGDPVMDAATEAAGFTVRLPNPENWANGKTIATINADDRAEMFFRYALGPSEGKNANRDDQLRAHVTAYVRVKHPDLYTELVEAQS